MNTNVMRQSNKKNVLKNIFDLTCSLNIVEMDSLPLNLSTWSTPCLVVSVQNTDLSNIVNLNTHIVKIVNIDGIVTFCQRKSSFIRDYKHR